MWERSAPFEGREDAGRRLSGELERRIPPEDRADAVVLALPRGGVVVGYEVARELSMPLDVIIARKLGAPLQPELGIGAIAPGGVRIVDGRIVSQLGISAADIDRIAAREEVEMDRRLRLYRDDMPPPSLAGRTVILVDDGLATGVTARAACRSIRAEGPRRLILAVPVAAPQSVESMREEADEIVALFAPPDFAAVGMWYRDFSQTTDEEVLALLQRSRQRHVQNNHPGEHIPMNQATTTGSFSAYERPVEIVAGNVTLQGDLTVPPSSRGIVIFAHGSGSSRHSERNRFVAREMNRNRLATLLMDLLTAGEEHEDAVTRQFRFDVEMLAERLAHAAEWVKHKPETEELRVGYFGASTGGGAALIAAVRRPDLASAVVSRGGRPDLAGERLAHVYTPSLLIVGGNDTPVIPLNRDAFERIPAEDKRLEIVPGATHLFEEAGALEEVARLATDWFVHHLDLAAAARAA
jgi:putative phosphoribosyl transferase